MRVFVCCLITILLLSFSASVQGDSAAVEKPATEAHPQVDLLTIDGPIGPISVRIIKNSIEDATGHKAQALIIEMNTPGGLSDATWSIVQTILASEIPVVVYVAPPGSRAASAGVYITYAAHIAAMAPQTNIGSAHPVTIGGQETDSVMMEKIVNDAVAKIKTLANKRHRNVEWAERAVRQSVSVTEYEALEEGVINYIADDIEDLLQKIDGDTVEVLSGPAVLETKTAAVEKIDIGFANRVLQIISDPNIAYILLTIGMLGLYFEFANPGAILPGVIGGICLILAFFAFQTLPINYAGLALMILATLLFLLEIWVTSHGILAVGGVISLFLGSLMLIEADHQPYLEISLKVIIPVVIGVAALFLLTIFYVVKAHKRKVATGEAGLIGETASVIEMSDGKGTVFVHGEYWQALGTEDFSKGTKVRVIGVEGMFVKVDKL